MEKLKKFIQTKGAKRALWTLLNSIMAMAVAYLTYMASDNIAWALSILPFAQAVSQFITKYLNTTSSE